ncbi:MAG: M48 family metallopeptidase [Phycisphaerales bacterium]|nr:M48 family metallopeptidase [Phycisphaerales bacterium]
MSGMPVDVVRKDIKNVHLAVYPPGGRVRIAAPRRLSDDAIRLAVVTRLGWIRRQQLVYAGQERQSEREMVSGESHFVQGRRYRLRVIESEEKPHARIRSTRTLDLVVSPGSSRKVRASVLDRWYRARLREEAQTLIEKWQPIVGVRVARWGIRKMRTRWGSCHESNGHILLNLELAKKDRDCLEYIVVHELVHLLEREHNDRFRALMDRFMPAWRSHRDKLNKAPLANEHWQY